MKRLLLSVCIPALTFFGFSLKAHAAETHSAPAFMNAEGEGIFPKGKTNDAYAQYFNGTSYLQALSTEGVAIANVTFEPGCRNFWHIHHKGGQILLVTGGPAVGKARAGAQARRRGEHSGRGQTLARRGQGQLVFPSCRGRSGGRGFQRMAGTSI